MKKNVPLRGSGYAKHLLKFLLLMKLAILLILFTAYQVQAGVFAQTVTVNAKQTEIKKILNSIEKKGDVRFLYNYELPELKAKVNFNAENLPVRSALDKLFTNTGLAYKILDNNLIVIHAKNLIEAIPVITITGKITADNGEALSGVSIMVKGTTKGTTTDNSGIYTLSVDKDAVLIVSYIGYESKEIAVKNQQVLNIKLSVSSKILDQVVVVGYGVQKRSLVTGSIASVTSKDIANIPHDGRVETALQGRTPGVIVGTNSGQPGTNNVTVRIRGVSSFTSGNDPLWVVDGIIVQPDNLNYLNQADIQSVEVLKDAAAAAIYGTRAGNGVILITTKKGSAGKISVNYNGYVGTQAAARLFPETNATEYATLMNEQNLADGLPMLYSNPSSLGEGTNWQKQIFSNSALRTNQELSLSGGNENANIYVLLGYQKQDGIVQPKISGFERYSARINHNEKFLKIFKFGQSIAYTRNKSKGVGTNTEYGEGVGNALQLDPLTPIIATAQQATAVQYQHANIVLAPNGLPYGISGLVTQEIMNPYVYQYTFMGNGGWSDNIIGNTYLEIAPMKGLTLRSQISVNHNYWGDESFTPQYYYDGIRQNSNPSLYRHNGVGTEWNWDNTISYTKSIKEHNFGVIVGHSVSADGIGYETWITYKNLQVNNYQDANFNWGSGSTTDITASTNDYAPQHRVVSLFGRINYDYKQKYLLTAIVRHDGSTNFGADHRWGTFPSVSVGWVPSMESFWKGNISKYINFLKIRGGYGIVGNDNFGPFKYAATIVAGNDYTIGSSGSRINGNSLSTLPNPNLKWEQNQQTDIGLDMRFLSDFNFSFDYFNRKTKGALLPLTLPQYVGVPNKPWANAGSITNQGIELQLGYNKQFHKWTVGATANFATLKNTVNDIGVGNPYAYFNEPSFQNMGTLTRAVIGYPVHGFWGYKTNGIFQTKSDVQNYKSTTGKVIQPNAKPGDFRWVDEDGSGDIGPNDYTYLGSSLPKYTFGLTINVGYGNENIGNFDLTVFINGQGGNKIFQNYRRSDAGSVNFPKSYLNRWNGAGTTNSFPRLATSGIGDANGNFANFSDFYLHKGDFLRVKNVQLGYSLPKNIAKKIAAEKLRVYIAVENLATFTKYDGFDPEIGGDTFGIDKGFYPQSRTFMAGVNLQF